MHPLVVLTVEAKATNLGYHYVLGKASQQACFLARTLTQRFSALIVHAHAEAALQQAAAWGAQHLYWQPLTGHPSTMQSADIIHDYVTRLNPDLVILTEHDSAAILAGWQDWPLIGGCTEIKRSDDQLICQHSLDHQDYISSANWPCVISCQPWQDHLSPPPWQAEPHIHQGPWQTLPEGNHVSTLAEASLIIDDPWLFRHAAATWLL